MQIPQDQVPEPSADPVTHHRRAYSTAHDEADPGGLTGTLPHQQVPDQQRSADPAAIADRRLELQPTAHPRGCRQHGPSPPGGKHCDSRFGRARAAQTLTRARPLRRRAASTARPARVRMRSRNPCVFARRRLFGWNVRLLTENSR